MNAATSDKYVQPLQDYELKKLQRESAVRKSQDEKIKRSLDKTEDVFKKEQDALFASQEKRRQAQLSRQEKLLKSRRKSDAKQQKEESAPEKQKKKSSEVKGKRRDSKQNEKGESSKSKEQVKLRKKRGKNRKDPLAFADVEPRKSTLLPPRQSEASQTDGDPSDRQEDDRKRRKGRLIAEVKDLTLVISGLLDQVQAKRENVMYLELSNANLCKQIDFHRDVVEKLENDLAAVEKDYTKADKQFQKGQRKSVVDKYYLKKNQELQEHIIESNIDLFVDLTVNDEVLPNVYRKLRAERMQEQLHCIEHLRERILRKRCELMRVQDSVAEEEGRSDNICKKSEDVQRKIEDMGYSDHEAETISKLRSVAYCLGYVQYQMDILTKEAAYTKELITSKRNEFANQLRFRAMVLGDKVQALQDAVATALHSVFPRGAEKAAKVSKCVRPRALPDERKDWILNQVALCQTQKQITKVEYENVSLDAKLLNARMHGKLSRLKTRLLFTLEKQRQVLSATRCDAAKQTEDVLFAPTCAIRIDD
ncbi:uncharacterized protein LOC129586858 [Paramacrobiotus metropolitanus]|uniref:uncharacterized protein LOC129586858 n=1 Tax=Paramacrobiotus metropolitanus TaxID=2943436 RepID=UPI0024465856|nr:uncharacterized protein LOC129586858 [Paramacrobiotus metropolitanus]